MRTVLGLIAAAVLLFVAPAGAQGQTVPPGFDLFETDPEVTALHFRGDFTIPPNFFDEGSEAFTGSVNFGGEPLGQFQGQDVGDADTVFRRVAPADVSPNGPPVPIELVALQLVSVRPIEVRVRNRTQEWEIFVGVSRARPSQGEMTIRQTSDQGGTADWSIQIMPLLRFVRLSDRATRTLDIGALPLTPAQQNELTLRVSGAVWRRGCELPALLVPGLNDAFCPAFSTDLLKVLTVQRAVGAVGIRPAQPQLEHFKCYSSRPRLPFRPRIVRLRDQFGSSRARVLRPLRLCTPARKDQERPVKNPVPHLQCYTSRRITAIRRPARVFVRNQFGPQVLRMGRPIALCVPSRKRRAGQSPPPASPNPELVLDHFQCWQVAGSIRPRAVTLRDQFGRERVGVRRAVELCAPVRKNTGRSNHPVRHLVCYLIRDPFRPVTGGVTNQFGAQAMRLLRPERLCVPSLKVWRPIQAPAA